MSTGSTQGIACEMNLKDRGEKHMSCWRIFQEGKAAWAVVEMWVKVSHVMIKVSSLGWLEH